MEQYYFKITSSYSDKNKLYAAFSNHISQYNGTLIKDKQARDAFIRSLQARLQHLNGVFSRCKPIELKEIKAGYSINPDAETVGLKVDGSWQASFYEIKRAVELQDGFLQYFIPDRNNPKILENY